MRGYCVTRETLYYCNRGINVHSVTNCVQRRIRSMTTGLESIQIQDLDSLISSLQKLVLVKKATIQSNTDAETQAWLSDGDTSCKITSKQCRLNKFNECQLPPWTRYLTQKVIKETYPYLRHFRTDVFGNLICLRLADGGYSTNHSICFYDMDHITPKSKGGSESCENGRALHSFANRLRQASSDNDMPDAIKRAGLDTEKLAKIYSFISDSSIDLACKHSLYRIVFMALNTPVQNTEFKNIQKTFAYNIGRYNAKDGLLYIMQLYVQSVDGILKKICEEK